MKIALITSFYGKTFGGAEVFTELLSRELVKEGHDVYILTTVKNNSLNSQVRYIKFTRFLPKKLLILGNVILDSFLGKCLITELKSINSDIIIVSDTYMVPASIIAAKELKIPLVAYVQNNVVDWVYDMLVPKFLSFILKSRNKTIIKSLKMANTIVSISHYIKSELVTIGVDAKKVEVIHHLPPEWNGKSITEPKDRVILFAPGRLSKEKGHRNIIKSIDLLRQKNKNFKLIIAGDGPEYTNLRKMVAYLRLDYMVEFTGWIPNSMILNLYEQSDVIIYTPIHPEAFGRVVLEGLFLGKPVIASSVGGIPEIIDNNVNGILVPPNDPKRLAEAIESLLDNVELRKIMGNAGLTTVREKFNATRLIDRWNNTIERTKHSFAMSEQKYLF